LIDVIGLLYALLFLIHNTFILVMTSVVLRRVRNCLSNIIIIIIIMKHGTSTQNTLLLIQ